MSLAVFLNHQPPYSDKSNRNIVFNIAAQETRPAK
jgi:hypothetical protein